LAQALYLCCSCCLVVLEACVYQHWARVTQGLQLLRHRPLQQVSAAGSHTWLASNKL
jgi:hypothetical protein